MPVDIVQVDLRTSNLDRLRIRAIETFAAKSVTNSFPGLSMNRWTDGGEEL